MAADLHFHSFGGGQLPWLRHLYPLALQKVAQDLDPLTPVPGRSTFLVPQNHVGNPMSNLGAVLAGVKLARTTPEFLATQQ